MAAYASAAAASSATGAGRASGTGPDVILAMRKYIDRMVMPKGRRGGIDGMKVLLLDEETKSMVSMVVGMTEILDREVFFVGNINRERDPMQHMKAIVFCRATASNLKLLTAELRDPKHSEYHLFFSNIVPPSFLEQLAKADVHSKIERVQEFYGDFYAVSKAAFSLNLGGALHMSRSALGPESPMTSHEATFQRSLDGVLGLLLAHKIKPAIRYYHNSRLAQQFATAVNDAMSSQRELFGLLPPRTPAPLLLVLDRREDPVTPLLTQWTYQAMMHETLGLWNNRIDLSGSRSVRPDQQQIVMDPSHDDFYAAQMYKNFGEFAEALQSVLREHQATRGTRDSVKSIEDMRALIERMPELRRKGANLEKHVTVMAELNRRIEAHKMFDLSELEQSLADTDSLARHFEQVGEAILDPGIRPIDALRLVMLFALRYEAEGGGRLAELKVALEGRGLKAGDIALIDTLLEYGGIRARGGDLFSKKTIAARMLRTVSRSVKGVESMLAQHSPLLEQILVEVGRGTLSPTLYPYAGKAEASPRVNTVVVFIVGGMTFEEAVTVNKINTAGTYGMDVILGGTAVQNSQSFMADLRRLAQDAASGATRPAAAAASSAAAGSVAVEVGGLVLSPARGSSSYGTLS